MIADSPLFADIDAIKLLIGFLFVVLPLIAKLISMFGNQAEPVKRVPPPVPPPAKPRLPPKPANPELNSEVEEFLRRAAERRTGEQRREAAATAQRPQPAPSRQPLAPVRDEPRKPPRRKPARQPLQAEVLDDVTRGRDVAEHVAQHFKPHQVLERAPSDMAVDQADEAMEEHLHSVFDHQLGKLRRPERAGAPTGASQVASPREPAAMEALDLAGLLRNPQTARQAIILNEILSRPEDRW
ncbi:MAG: hypothetical protein HY000_07195 [Planctomycetes bacterium]|nr:hypothetical protein [Planctomycetota bacterium]